MFDRVRAWFRPPGQLIAIFALVTLVPSLLLVAFGWRLLQQDISLEQSRRDARRAEAADLLVTALEQAVSSTERVLRDREAMRFAAVTPDSVTLAIDDQLEVLPHGRLLYYPVASPGAAAADDVFVEGETLEYAQNDPRRAAAWFDRLARAAPAAIRAGALVRGARNLRKSGRPDAALASYSEAARLATTAIGEVPTELFARSARCSLLADVRRTSELRREALELRELLLEGRWRITRPVFEAYLQSASEWAGAGEPPAHYLLALSAAVDAVWRSRRSPSANVADEWIGRRSTMSAGSVQFIVLSQQLGDRTHVLIAGPAYVQERWKSAVAPLESRHRVHSTLQDPGQRGSPDVTRRPASDTGLPWTLAVKDVASADRSGQGRRSLWIAAAGILACLVLTGAYVVGRAVSRELAVARLQTDFVSAVSHEFRTPLTSLRQLSEMLMDRADAPADRRRAYYEALQRQTERLHRLVEGLLDFGRMEAGTTPYRLEPVDAAAFVGEIVAQFGSDPAARNHEIQVRTSTTTWMAADRDALGNVLWNLLDNAAKYSPGDARLDVSVETESGKVVIKVIDRGFGIPPEEQRDVFRKFVRGSRAKAEGIGGTGIGLAMVQHVVEAHGGTVGITSSPGSGTTVTLRMPVSKSAPSAEVAPCLES